MNAELVSKLDKIYKRLEALEVVHTRYQGPKGPKGDSGEPGPAGRDGRDSTVARARNQVTEELNAFRRELHDYRIAVCAELRQLCDEYAERLAEIYCKGVGAICDKRDKA